MGTEIEMDIIIRQELNFENYFSVSPFPYDLLYPALMIKNRFHGNLKIKILKT
jgi:hypothetical protein